MLKNETLDNDVNIHDIGKQAEGLSGSDLKELCRSAAMNAFVRNMRNNSESSSNDEPLNICKDDFNVAFEKLENKRNAVTYSENLFSTNSDL